MGKKGRKTRWRTLTITDEHSDSEESNTTTSGHRVPKGYPPKAYYSKFTYSSQSTPTRRYQCDGTKSTRSSSTASENKITFNEDEYTRITTPRQDVLFKKGYLNKPKTYQTQTSTGNSTTSTGNSTGNGTPDHQSTDLEYESQFVFPNGFVDQNGIYYVNSFEPYPLMVFNPPTYYPEFTSVKSKRCSTDSLTESTSPNNEEASQEISQSETPSNVSDFNNQVYNVVYPGFYYEGACQSQDVANQLEPRRMKKKRRRKRSKPVEDGTTSEYTDDSSDEASSDNNQEKAEKLSEEAQDGDKETVAQTPSPDGSANQDQNSIESSSEEAEPKSDLDESKEQQPDGLKHKYDLKPDAEEFVPRAYRQPESIPVEQNVQFFKLPSNFVPLPIINPMGEFNAFIPPGIPINFIPQNYFIPNNFINKNHNVQHAEEEKRETVEVPKNHIDIAKIVSKLEEAAKEQDSDETVNKASTQEKRCNGDVSKPLSRKPSGRILKKNRYQKPDDETDKKTAWKQSPKKEISAQNSLPPKPIRNYSDTLKKPLPSPQQYGQEKRGDKQKTPRSLSGEVMMKKQVKVEPAASRDATEWISVSSRKKRKNKNVEETEEFEESPLYIEKETEHIPETQVQTEQIPETQFETEQIPETQLETVHIPEIQVITNPIPEIQVASEQLPEVQVETVPVVAVSENVETPRLEETEVNKIETLVTPAPVKEEPRKEKSQEKSKTGAKKKSKKNQKPPVKRVIITDVLPPDLNKTVEEDKVEKVEITPVKEVMVEEATTKVEEEKSEPVEEKIEVVDKRESPEKKSSKKKKKKSVKLSLGQSEPSTSTSTPDDSYDFLLDSCLLEESNEKTNVEVSQELDRMIQKGMYSNLEEKIKSLNIETNDNFFKSIIHNISSKESSNSNSYSRTPDISKVLNGTSHFLRAKPIVDNKLETFLGESTPKSNAGGVNQATRDDLYPITKAVKEWMSKTRETTPDVEILKSPSTILREFGIEKNDRESNSLSANEDTGVDEELTMYSFGREGSADLLDCWEDELSPIEGDQSKQTASSSSREGEDVLEIYESKYGKNEDYLKIKAEIEERAANFPKHGNLPYRAICCSIM